MALNFPSSPVVGQVYQRWTWNGIGWAPSAVVSVPMLPIAGGNITGNLGVAGTTSLTGTLTAAGATNLNTLQANGAVDLLDDLDVQGAATFHDGVTIGGVDTADFALTDWVQGELDAIKNLGFFAGGFPTFASLPTNRSALPDLTPNDFVTVAADETHGGASTRYVCTDVAADGTITWTYDFTYSTDITGKMDLVPTATDGNLAMFDDSGDGQVEDAGFAPADVLRRGLPGTYTQGTDFTDLQTFLDESINNRWFTGAVTINVNVPTTYQTTMRNVRGAATITINTDVQIAAAFICQDMGVLLVINGSGPTTTTSMWLRGGSVQLRGAQPAGAGSTMYGSVNVAWETGGTYLHAGNVAADNIAITTLTVNSPSLAFLGAGGSTVGVTTLANHGLVIIPSNATNLTVNNWGTGAGAIIDNRTILARRDTYVRAATATRTMTVDIADLQTTINSLPKILTGTVNINVNPGTITTGITVAQFSGPGILAINGATSATNTHNVLNFLVEQCTLARFTIRGFNATATTGVAFHCRNCIGAFNYWYMCTATGGVSSTSGNNGFYNEESTFTYWSGCVASNKNAAFNGRSGTWRSTGCSGVNNNTAWLCQTGIFFNQGETAVGATTRYSIGEGGMIIDGTGTIFTQKGQVN